MADKNTENITTKFRVDISDLKKGISDANKTIKLANAQFKNSTAAMDDWASSADGLTAKIEQQEKILDAEKKKLDALKEELSRLNDACKTGQGIVADLSEKYEQAAETYGATSEEARKYARMLEQAQTAQQKNEKAAEDLNLKIINQDTAVQKTSSQLKTYNSRLTDLKSSTEYLKNEQKRLNDAYDDAVSKYGKHSDEAKKLKDELKKVSDELKNTKDSTGKLSDEFDKTDDSARNTEGGFTIMKGALADLVSEGIKKAIDAFGDLLTASDKAANSLQAQTGLSTSEMEEFKDEMDDLYRNNYGESLEDIGNAMAIVKQNTKDTDASSIKDLTKNAILLRDTFGFDIQETMRAANMLMTQFGISGDEAFTLIAQGAQNGLNKNEDLLDTINEYSVHYKQQGFSAEEFFNSLYNGAESGTFSIDKLGDAMKEFGIRTKDSSDITMEGFGLIGLNADKMRDKFAEGGESAREATEETIDALFSLDDQVKRNQAGVDLFGTMWEDLGADGIKALTDVSGKADKTADTLEKIDEIKYNDSQNSLEDLSRTLKTDILQPLADKLIPKIKEAIDWVKKKTPEIKKAVNKYIVDPFEDKLYPILKKVVEFAKDAFDFALENLPEIISLIGGIGTAVAGWTIATKIGKVVDKIKEMHDAIKTGSSLFEAFNTVMGLNPAIAIAGAIAGIIGAIITYRTVTQDATEDTQLFNDKQQATIDKCNEVSEAFEESKEKREELFSDKEAEFAYYEDLAEELDTIADKNGKIKEGYEDRAEFIVTELNDALGTEMEVTDGVIQKYDDLREKIADLIEIKKGEAILSSMEGDYTDAITNRTDAWDAYNDAAKDVAETEAEIVDLEKAVEEAQKELNNAEGQVERITATTNLSAYMYDLEVAKDRLKEQTKAMNDAEDAYVGYNAVINNYSNLSEAVISENVDKINDALLELECGFVTSEEASGRILRNQRDNAKKHLQDLQEAFEDGSPYVTQAMVDEAKEMVEKCDDELSKLESKARNNMKKAVSGVVDGARSRLGAVNIVGGTLVDTFVNAISSSDKLESSEKAGVLNILNFVRGIKGKISYASDGANSVIKSVFSSWTSPEHKKTAKKAGADSAQKFADGITSKKSSAKEAVGEMISEAEKKLEELDAKPFGENFVSGFIGGINGMLGYVNTTVSDLGTKSLDWLKKRLNINSPSKETEKIGEFFDLGFINAISGGEGDMIKAVRTMAGNVLAAMQSALRYDELSAGVAAANSGLTASTAMHGGSGAQIAPVSNVYNFTQNNTSPKALSRHEIYRQTKNLINTVKKGG